MSDKKKNEQRRRVPAKGEDELPPVELYYDARDGAYWYRINGQFVAMKKGDIKLQLQRIGYSDFPSSNMPGVSIIDVPFIEAQDHRMVHFTGPLAGHRIGLFKETGGKNCLVTEEANARVFADMPKKSPLPKRLLAFIEQLLPGDQSEFFLWWLAIGFKSLRRGDFQPGQLVVFAGEAGCGKSLVQNIITEVMGGRVADPFRYMNGLTQFNKDIASAEHWQMSDPPTTTDMRTRLKFGDYIKDATVNRDLAVHGKGKDALCLLPVHHRMTLSINDETECLAIVPPMIGSLVDKIFLFKCSKASVGTDRAATWKWIQEEIPLLQAHLARYPELPPPEFRDERFKIKAWHHPELMEELCALSSEHRLLQIIDQVFFTAESETVVKFKAIDLEKKLRESDYGFAVERLLSFTGACGSHLAKLAKKLPERVQKSVRDGANFWTISPPKKDKPE